MSTKPRLEPERGPAVVYHSACAQTADKPTRALAVHWQWPHFTVVYLSSIVSCVWFTSVPWLAVTFLHCNTQKASRRKPGLFVTVDIHTRGELFVNILVITSDCIDCTVSGVCALAIQTFCLLWIASLPIVAVHSQTAVDNVQYQWTNRQGLLESGIHMMGIVNTHTVMSPTVCNVNMTLPRNIPGLNK